MMTNDGIFDFFDLFHDCQWQLNEFQLFFLPSVVYSLAKRN
jgi:hypothetical protein